MAERPMNDNIFIYMHIHHVSQIETVNQTFDTKFYLRATWVQPIRTGVLTPEKFDVDNWSDEIYKPQLDFDNAKEIIELQEQSLAISDWREVKMDERFDREKFKYYVMEWKASGFGTFTYKINLHNYPYDLQMLKVTIGSKDPKVRLRDDWTDGVQSTIRKDYVLDLGFEFLDVYSFLFGYEDEDEENVGSVLAAIEEEKVISPNKKAMGHNVPPLFLKKNKARKFSNLSYVLLVKRYGRHSLEEIAIPITLITLSSFASFIFDPDEAADRLAVSVTIALVMSSYAYLVSEYVPKLHKRTLYTSHLLFSFILVFLVVFQNALVSAINCGGQCEDNDDDGDDDQPRYDFSAPSGSIWFWDWLSSGTLLLAWLVWNVWLYFEVYIMRASKEYDRVKKALAEFENQVIDPGTREIPSFRMDQNKAEEPIEVVSFEDHPNRAEETGDEEQQLVFEFEQVTYESK